MRAARTNVMGFELPVTKRPRTPQRKGRRGSQVSPTTPLGFYSRVKGDQDSPAPVAGSWCWWPTI